jgi:non-specific serine/threonine protein kinase
VVHFDRWWNPAVEIQATDRAFRIGQQKNVVVHKFITEGTIEEKIDDMLEAKARLSEDVIAAGGESWITELENDQLLDLFRLGLS